MISKNKTKSEKCKGAVGKPPGVSCRPQWACLHAVVVPDTGLFRAPVTGLPTGQITVENVI